MRKTLTNCIRQTLNVTPEAKFDNTILLLSVYEQHGLILTKTQKKLISLLPDPSSAIRIGNRERKFQQSKRKVNT